MTNEIQVFENNGELVVSSRQIAKDFGKRHDHTLRDIENLISQNPILGVEYFHKSLYKSEKTGKSYKEYLLNRDGFSLLVMGFTGKKALDWKIKYIEAFNMMESKLKEKAPVTLEEQMAQGLIAAHKLLAEKNKQIEEMKPKAEFYDDVTGSDDTISIGSVAKVLNIPNLGKNKLFAFLREQKVLGRRNEPYQQYIDKGYFRQIETSYEVDGDVHINLKTVVFQSGLDFIRKLIAKNMQTI